MSMILVTTGKRIETLNIRDVIANDNHVRDTAKYSKPPKGFGKVTRRKKPVSEADRKGKSKRVFQRLPRKLLVLILNAILWLGLLIQFRTSD